MTSQPEPFDKLLYVHEVATTLRVSKMTVYRMIRAGELPAMRIGRSFRIPERSLQAYYEAAFVHRQPEES